MKNRWTYMLTGFSILAVSIAGCGKKSNLAKAKLVAYDRVQQLDATSLGADVAFIDYTSGETDMQIMLYRDGEDVVHGAFNTCQICNGSPYAYFEQEEDEVVCQNCGNHFSVIEIGVSRGGCNPIPLEFEQDGDAIRISTSYLDENAELFKNWKKGI